MQLPLSGSQFTATPAGARPMIRRDSKLMAGGLEATPGAVCGLDYMKDPKLNKGSSFTIEERQTLGIHGLLPPRVKTQAEQAAHSLKNLRRLSDPLNQYMYMVSRRFTENCN